MGVKWINTQTLGLGWRRVGERRIASEVQHCVLVSMCLYGGESSAQPDLLPLGSDSTHQKVREPSTFTSQWPSRQQMQHVSLAQAEWVLPGELPTPEWAPASGSGHLHGNHRESSPEDGSCPSSCSENCSYGALMVQGMRKEPQVTHWTSHPCWRMEPRASFHLEK